MLDLQPCFEEGSERVWGQACSGTWALLVEAVNACASSPGMMLCTLPAPRTLISIVISTLACTLTGVVGAPLQDLLATGLVGQPEHDGL